MNIERATRNFTAPGYDKSIADATSIEDFVKTIIANDNSKIHVYIITWIDIEKVIHC